MSDSASLVAQAKINLFLRILAREAGGYHQIETLFCRLSLGDSVRVRVTDRGRSLDCAGPAMPAGGLGPTERNLAWRAAVSFAESAGWPRGFAVEVEKRIPVGGGLGGGSADAGAVLRLLNALAPSPLPASRLIEIAGTLGADVPFLTQDGSALALAWGRGDRLLDLMPLPPRECLLISAPFGVSTADAYRWFAESLAAPAGPVVASTAELSTWKGVDRRSQNDLESVVLSQETRLAEAFAALRTRYVEPGQAVVRMSGSGSTLFALASGLGLDATALSLPNGFTADVTWTAADVAPVRMD
ncbi:MAG: 4-(cytidine 5'-diphospho)-2-C-methyl-D-erythritol kinase [Gemmatimonadaceae bacterium]